MCPYIAFGNLGSKDTTNCLQHLQVYPRGKEKEQTKSIHPSKIE
jgi:hypothetical protein